jgi:diamine N-acetyltransferase
MNLTGTKIYLRRLRATDLEYLYASENDPAVWRYGDCGFAAAGMLPSATPERFSRDELRRFIENQQHDISETEQLRLVICRRDPSAAPPVPPDETAALSGTPIGFIDLFDIDPVVQSAGVGILICDPADRRRGYSREALTLAMEYARRTPGLRSLWCHIAPGNTASTTLFTAAGFVRSDNETRALHLTLPL